MNELRVWLTESGRVRMDGSIKIKGKKGLKRWNFILKGVERNRNRES